MVGLLGNTWAANKNWHNLGSSCNFPRTPNDHCFAWKGLVLEGWPSKIEVIWALGWRCNKILWLIHVTMHHWRSANCQDSLGRVKLHESSALHPQFYPWWNTETAKITWDDNKHQPQHARLLLVRLFQHMKKPPWRKNPSYLWVHFRLSPFPGFQSPPGLFPFLGSGIPT